ncbi:hypothetical protein [Vulgatibacter sp.]|uniref:hypothetical protein n=1 Tax=Vulgatibacter sp. TaxID=1971226 RepID=UPI0035612A42
MENRAVPAFVAMVLALAAALFPAQSPAPAQAQPAGPEEKLFFSMQIADEQGDVIAEPKLLGMCGVPVEMTLADPGNLEMPKMSLRLESALESDGSYAIAYELAVPGLAAHGKGTVRVRPGEEKSTRLQYPGGHLDVQLAAFAVPSAEFQLFLRHGIGTRGPSHT